MLIILRARVFLSCNSNDYPGIALINVKHKISSSTELMVAKSKFRLHRIYLGTQNKNETLNGRCLPQVSKIWWKPCGFFNWVNGSKVKF